MKRCFITWHMAANLFDLLFLRFFRPLSNLAFKILQETNPKRKTLLKMCSCHSPTFQPS